MKDDLPKSAETAIVVAVMGVLAFGAICSMTIMTAILLKAIL